MIEFLNILPELIVTVGIVYFAINPWLKQQMTLNVVNLFLIALILITLSFYFDVMNYLELTIIIGSTFLIATVIRGILRWKKRDYYLLINVFPNSFSMINTFLIECCKNYGLDEREIIYSSKTPFLVTFQSNKHREINKIIKETEKFIHDHIHISFWHCYIWTICASIFIAIIWRF
ncbi:MAG: hypothetical protein WC088_04460 [Candidatus Izemoplasmatales bacterium]|jgi:hypothetical protein|nr:hypothetical protein [Candidatus Izemoplasmatales bacterium]MDD4595260.1 hypothetical protein [Candidatus Izemoplasmatales bacterium]